MAHAQFTPWPHGFRAIQSRDLVDELLRVALVAGQPVRLAERREVLAAAELPRHLDVRRTIELLIVDVAARTAAATRARS